MLTIKRAIRYGCLITAAVIAFMPCKSSATFTDTAIDWALFDEPAGYTIPYTFNGQPVSDEQSSSDSTNGGAAVSIPGTGFPSFNVPPCTLP